LSSRELLDNNCLKKEPAIDIAVVVPQIIYKPLYSTGSIKCSDLIDSAWTAIEF
jgi:hypothetical protein